MVQAMHGKSAGHHIIPVRVLASVFGVLVLLTVVTVITARLDLGALNVPLAIAIAASKAALVVSVFMALRHDNHVNALVFFIGTIFVVVFLALTLSDTALRGALGITDAGVMTGDLPSPETASYDGAPAITDTSTADANEAAASPVATPVVPDTATAGSPNGVQSVITLPAEAEEIDIGADPIAAIDGSTVYTRYLCQTCHSVDGAAGVGPTLQGIGARQSRDEITSSIMDPDLVLVEGFAPGVMTATLTALRFFDNVTEDELEALVAYIVSL